MRGSIAIPEEVVKNNQMGWTVFDFLKRGLKRYTDSPRAGWYAYRLRDGVYQFLWTDEHLPSEFFMKELEKDGWNTSVRITSQVITDAFKIVE